MIRTRTTAATLARGLHTLLASRELRQRLGGAARLAAKWYSLPVIARLWEHMFQSLGAPVREESRHRILFVSPSMAGGGAERVLLTLLRHLDRKRFAPCLALADASGPLLEQVPMGVPVLPLGKGRVRFSWLPLIRAVRRQRPHTVLSSQGHMNLLTGMARPFFPRGTRVIARESSILGAKLAAGDIPSWYPWLYRRIYPGFERIICQSEDMMHDLGQALPPGAPLVRIPNPVDVQRLKDLALREPEIPLPVERPYFVTMGRLIPSKGLPLLLEALARISGPRQRLLVIGHGPLEESLKKQARALKLADRVFFTGFLHNPYPFLAKAERFIFPSFYEGFPNALLEALALGVPAVAFSCPGGVSEIVRPGDNGWLAPVGDVPAMAALLGKHAPVMWGREAISEDIRKRFGLERIIGEYERLLIPAQESGAVR